MRQEEEREEKKKKSFVHLLNKNALHKLNLKDGGETVSEPYSQLNINAPSERFFQHHQHQELRYE